MFIVNGKEIENSDGILLEKYINENGFKKERIAVEINGVIIKKSDYSNYVINKGDNIIIVSFVGGGWIWLQKMNFIQIL